MYGKIGWEGLYMFMVKGMERDVYGKRGWIEMFIVKVGSKRDFYGKRRWKEIFMVKGGGKRFYGKQW